jgi:uncharacterized protein (UPF0332 family)
MNISMLKQLLENRKVLENKINAYEKGRIIQKFDVEENEILGHINKAEYNLRFVKDNIELGYLDWCVTGCYYSAYHACISLLISKGINSKSHDATLCVLIRDFYLRGIEEDDISFINRLLMSYEDLIFYVQTKEKREEASYSSKLGFDSKEVNEMRLETIKFVNKVKDILQVQHEGVVKKRWEIKK